MTKRAAHRDFQKVSFQITVGNHPAPVDAMGALGGRTITKLATVVDTPTEATNPTRVWGYSHSWGAIHTL